MRYSWLISHKQFLLVVGGTNDNRYFLFRFFPQFFFLNMTFSWWFLSNQIFSLAYCLILPPSPRLEATSVLPLLGSWLCSFGLAGLSVSPGRTLNACLQERTGGERTGSRLAGTDRCLLSQRLVIGGLLCLLGHTKRLVLCCVDFSWSYPLHSLLVTYSRSHVTS